MGEADNRPAMPPAFPDFLLDGSFKSFPQTAAPCAASAIAERGWNLLAGDLPLPLAVLKRSALTHNLAWMQDFARRKGVSLAPHGKTTMAPALFALQLQAGAWGLTFATAFQAAVGVAAGARRIVIANQVVCDADFDVLDALLTRHPDLWLCFLVDAPAQLALLEDWQRRRASARVFDVLLEIGEPGARTGCRSAEQALTLARAIAASGAARLAGLECYEGVAAHCDSAHDADAVGDLVRRALAVAHAIDAERLWAASAPEIVLSAGGSAVFDLVVPLLQARGLSCPVRGVLRSGCYLTHDHGNYRRYLHLVEQREGLQDSLLPALSVWAMVQSLPEPGLALLGCGKRDISHDLEMPIPVGLARRGALKSVATPPDWRISALNDQHAYLRFPPGAHASALPRIGDRVELGISHPCTTFDKWRWMPIVEDDGRVSGAIQTFF